MGDQVLSQRVGWRRRRDQMVQILAHMFPIWTVARVYTSVGICGGGLGVALAG